MKWHNVMICSTLIGTAVLVTYTINSCNSNTTLPVERIVYVPVPDTTENVNRIIELEHELQLTKDSLEHITDSLGEDLVLARIKLARIKEYNRIAAKGNNIKYLRGWINRVLETN